LSGRKPAIFSGVRRIFKSASHKRLDTAIEPFELELSQKIKEIEKEDSDKKERLRNAAATCLQMVKCAKRALSLCEIELGWRFLFQAELMSLYLIEDKKDALRERALATLNEGEEKLDKWRKKTVQKLLGKDGDLKADYTVEDVYRAQKILQEHHTNTYIKLRTAQFQLEILALVAILPIVSLVFLLPRVSGQIGLNNFPLVIAVAMLGVLGGCFSGIFSIARSSNKGRIPDQLLSSWLTISRPIVGAIAALAISMFLLSGLIQLGTLTEYLILAVSFGAGFSERLLVKAVESTSGAT
jgi:vacuolar-type H+-ATPase subunit E/Vma4